MRVGEGSYRTIWSDQGRIRIIDQTVLPHEFRVIEVPDLVAMAHAIRSMQVRGAPLIGAAAAYGVALAMRRNPSDAKLDAAADLLIETRPTAVNLRWALERMRARLRGTPTTERATLALAEAERIADEDVAANRRIGEHALPILQELHERLGRRAGGRVNRPLNLLTHCNAGWLATVDHGTATAGMYAAHDVGLPLHVWVDETRPRGQGARLTAWELGQHGVPHTVVPDTAAAHLMARGDVDAVIVGTDRTTAGGDVVNKIGTLSVALAAQAHEVPFYVAAPGSSLDFDLDSGTEVPIEERAGREVSEVSGRTSEGRLETVRVVPDGSAVRNWAFDVTPAGLVTAIITERGVAPATRRGLASLYPERATPAGDRSVGPEPADPSGS